MTFLINTLTFQETDIAVTALVMTADREEMIDFVAPYFEQSGISIGNGINLFNRYYIVKLILSSGGCYGLRSKLLI